MKSIIDYFGLVGKEVEYEGLRYTDYTHELFEITHCVGQWTITVDGVTYPAHIVSEGMWMCYLMVRRAMDEA